MSPDPKPDTTSDPFDISEEEIDEVLYEVKGDPREAIRRLLRDLAVMAMDADAAVSRGYVRGWFSGGHRRPPPTDDA